MMAYTYRRLTPSDEVYSRQLLKVFAEAFVEVEKYRKLAPSDEYLATLLAKEHFIALVAQAGDEVVGGLAAYVLQKIEQERSEIYIYDLAVVKEHRRKGIATVLIEKLKEMGKEMGAYVIFVQADREDEPAIKLYESLATSKEKPFHFDIQIP
jgi:aminoglycoside 3-N-acetyltransferase I